ncbi:MAG: HD domain-containing phosphohydrolase, partial [Planctomycetota bacterium]
MKNPSRLINIISALANHSLNLEEVFSFALEKTLKLMGAQVGGLFLLDAPEKELDLKAYRPLNLPPRIIEQIKTIKLGEGYAGRVALSGQPIAQKNLAKFKEPSLIAAASLRLRSVIATPLKYQNKVLGSLVIFTDTVRIFNKEEINLLSIIGNQIGTAIEHARLYEKAMTAEDQLMKRHQEQLLLLNVGQMILSNLSSEEVLQNIVEASLKNLNMDVALIRIVEDKRLNIKTGAYRYPEEREQLEHLLVKNPLYLGQGVAGQVIQTGIPSLINEGEPNLSKLTVPGLVNYLKNRSWIVVPLKIKDKIIGVLILIAKRKLGLNDLSLAVAVANQSAIALENSFLFRKVLDEADEIESLYEQTISALASALDAREKKTSMHSMLVTQYALRMARELNNQELDLSTLIKSSLLHDIGKIGIPDVILLKGDELSEPEREIIKQHSRIGYNILQNVPALHKVAKIILAHQEWYNGNGYPQGLAKEEIPLEARIFAIADTLDAITSSRPYRAENYFEKARAEIVRYKGTQFDPKLVEVFLSIPKEEW